MEIKFIAKDKNAFEIRDRPIPASEMIPSWWKEMQAYPRDGKLKLDPFPAVTAKKCFPLLDGITSGYIVTLWADIFVEQTFDGPYIKWLVTEDVAQMWSQEQTSTYEIPDGYSHAVFKYVHGWNIETPPGTSCLITHPIGYPNLPFKTLTGVVDTDALKTRANSPFVIKEGFEGIIEKGTPMFQIIPFKRYDWNATYDYLTYEEDYIRNEKLYSKIVSSYGRFMRSRKSYK